MIYGFGSFELDVGMAELRLDGEPVPLEPKPFALLVHLLSQPDAVATKDELFDVLWPDTIVSESALTSAVKLARRALRRGGVSEAEGLGIKTVHGRGFRFVGEVRRIDPASAAAEPEPRSLPPSAKAEETGFIGRVAERAEIARLLEAAGEGGAQLVLVAGDAGIGKTALVDASVEHAQAAGVRVALGHSVEHYGAGEAYLPILEAWGRLVRGPKAEKLSSLMRRMAPTWRAHFPPASSAGEPAEAPPPAGRVTKDRMLREMVELLEAATEERPLLLVLEDMHWSDHATIELVAYLFQRRSSARMLVVGTYRPSEVVDVEHPLRRVVQGLGVRERVTELRHGPLALPEVGAYLRHRLPGGVVGEELIDQLNSRTEGQPLFLSNVVDYALSEGAIALEGDTWTLREAPRALVPDDVRQLIERQVESLSSTEQRLLEAASVVGIDFSVAAVVAATDLPESEIEGLCETLAWQGQFLEDAGVEEWPDGTLAGRYRFQHSLYVDVLYARIASARRLRFHRAIAERREAAFGDRASEIAGELARQFEFARDAQRAIEYRERAAALAVTRQAHREAIGHLDAALRLLPGLPEGAERDRKELSLLVELVGRYRSARIALSPTTVEQFERAVEFARRFEDDGLHVRLLLASANGHLWGGRTREAIQSGREALALCERGEDPIGAVQAHHCLGVSLLQLGNLAGGEAHLRKAIDLYDPESHAHHVSVFGDADPAVAAAMFLSGAMTDRGFPETGHRLREEAMARAQSLGHSLTLSWSHLMSSMAAARRGDPSDARRELDAAASIAREHGFEGELIMTGLFEGWILLLEGRLDEASSTLRYVLAEYEDLGLVNYEPLCRILLGMTDLFSGRVDDCWANWARSLEISQRTEQPLMEVSLRRLRGAALAAMGRTEEAEADLLTAGEMAHRMGDRLGELDGAWHLCGVWMGQGRTKQARALLEPLYEAFTEGFDERVLIAARERLDELGAPQKR